MSPISTSLSGKVLARKGPADFSYLVSQSFFLAPFSYHSAAKAFSPHLTRARILE